MSNKSTAGRYENDPFQTIIESLTSTTIQASSIQLTEANSYLNDAQLLTIKLWRQVCSAKSLLEHCTVANVNGEDFPFVDFCSIGILTRSCLESFLTLHWIFANDDLTLTLFRHAVWTLGGLQDRRNHRTVDGKPHKAQLDTNERIDALTNLIKESPHLASYSTKHQKLLLKGFWKEGYSWKRKAIDAQFDENFYSNVYDHLSGYVHSGYISAIQIRDADSINVQADLGAILLSYCTHIIARTVFLHSKIFKIDLTALLPNEALSICKLFNFTASHSSHLYPAPATE